MTCGFKRDVRTIIESSPTVFAVLRIDFKICRDGRLDINGLVLVCVEKCLESGPWLKIRYWFAEAGYALGRVAWWGGRRSY